MPEVESPALLNFQEFVKTRAEEYGSKERRERREEWLLAIRHFLDCIDGWLYHADPQQYLDKIPYEVSRTEPLLGTYDAPALRIALGPGKADLIPIGRSPSARFDPALFGLGTQLGGRIDLTDGFRKHVIYRVIEPSGESWRYIDDENLVRVLDQESCVTLLQELLS